MKKINRQNGFSQILILIIISFLAIALPVTTKLVQKAQDTRSSARAPIICCNRDANCGVGYYCDTRVSSESCSANTSGDGICKSKRSITPTSTPTSTPTPTPTPTSTSTCSGKYGSGTQCFKGECGSGYTYEGTATSCYNSVGSCCKAKPTDTTCTKGGGKCLSLNDCNTALSYAGGSLGSSSECSPSSQVCCHANSYTPICSSSHCNRCGSAYDCSRVGCKWDGSKCASSSSTPTPTPGKGVCSASNCIACIEASKCSSAGCYWETAMKVCAGSPNCSASNCTACSGSVQCKATSGCQWDSVNSAGCFSASKYCGTANSTLVSSLPTGSSACKGASFQPSDSSAADGTYNWACINGSVRSLCSAIKKCVSSTDLPKCSDDSKSLMTCNANGTWNTESCSHGCFNGACKTYYSPDGGASDEIPTPTGIGTTTIGGTKLSFKIAFMGVKPSPTCLDNFKTVAITVGKVGTTLSQDLSVSVTGIGETNSSGYGIFKAENVALGTGFSGASNIYVKIKGSVHSKMYYCASGQSAKNTSQTCTVATDGTFNNFYNYPILAGDVDQDGAVTVIDFGLIRKSLFVVGCSKGDLNGDGLVNDFDIKLYKVALEAKYDE